MHICDYRVGVDIYITYNLILNVKSRIHQRNIITLHYKGRKFLQSGLEGNKYNNIFKLSNHATLNHAVHHAIPQNTELTIYQETIQLAQIKIKFFQKRTYNIDKYQPYLNDFLLDQEIINLGPVAPRVQLGTFQKRTWHQKSCLPQLKKKMLGFQTS